MSQPNERVVSDSLIDRLVDGELDDAERRQLLIHLEAEPGGWRRCALAFLEAQAWTRSLRAVPGTTSSRRPVLTATLGPKSPLDESAGSMLDGRTQQARSIRPTGLRAAGILLAFVSGWLFATAWRAPGAGEPPLQAGSSALPHGPIAPPRLTEAADSPSKTQIDSTPAPSSPLGLVASDESPWSSSFSPPFPDPLRRHLERQGYHVEQRSGLVSMELKDGQRFGVPVDEVELRYVGNRVY